jgi:hypothetical protein
LRTINNPDEERFAYMTLGDPQDSDGDEDGDDDGDGDDVSNTKRELALHGKSKSVYYGAIPHPNNDSRGRHENCQ